MKKIILSLAFVASGLFALTANAQQNSNQPACCQPNAECCQPGAECCQTPHKLKMKKAPKVNPFEGITLTEAQKTSIAQLNETKKKERVEAQKAKKENQKAERKKFKDGKKEYLKELQKILTPEQYTTYLENMVLNSPKGQKNMSKDKFRGPKGMKKGGPKGERLERKDFRKDGQKDKKDVQISKRENKNPKQVRA